MDYFSVPAKRRRGVHARRRVARFQMEDTLWPSMGWRAWARYILLKLRRSAANPHRVALGMAIGMWANFLPLPGMGSTFSIAFAWLLRANVMAAFIGQLVGNAWTMPLIWWGCYKVGLVVFPLHENGIGFGQLMGNFNLEFVMENWRVLAKSVMLPLVTGGQMVGIPLALASYWLTSWEVKRFWAHRRALNEARHGVRHG